MRSTCGFLFCVPSSSTPAPHLPRGLLTPISSWTPPTASCPASPPSGSGLRCSHLPLQPLDGDNVVETMNTTHGVLSRISPLMLEVSDVLACPCGLSTKSLSSSPSETVTTSTREATTLSQTAPRTQPPHNRPSDHSVDADRRPRALASPREPATVHLQPSTQTRNPVPGIHNSTTITRKYAVPNLPSSTSPLTAVTIDV
ncbi:hypothetical protein GALMADRAFT_136580 [Galerina marginata CBS 339.88]|uniref:Uncharacterized protein n=1 Tax=Galerina marginata (strain CBS 339.88) TaxID=685588 RepID=A0A067TA73_GALM3|nr:hypothetical protein GALMADRAFT_136580 [Galerina marginata CBS 339.88]